MPLDVLGCTRVTMPVSTGRYTLQWPTLKGAGKPLKYLLHLSHDSATTACLGLGIAIIPH